MVLYAAFDYFVVFTDKSERTIRCIGKWLAVFAGYSVIAVLLAGIILLPVILPVFGTGRFQAENYVPLFYDRIYYEKYLSCLIGENMIQWGSGWLHGDLYDRSVCPVCKEKSQIQR